MLLDSHCHLDFEAFDPDREQVLERARQAGVTGIINPAVDVENSRNIVRLVETYPLLYAAVGVHPNSASIWQTNLLQTLREFARHPKIVAIGEIGLDYYRERASVSQQFKAFQDQLKLAAETGLPVIIHTRNQTPTDNRAIAGALEILAKWQEGLANSHSPLLGRLGVLHSYSGNLENALQAIELGFFIGITGPVTFKNAAVLQQLVAELPLERLLIETDAPFLTPQPYRGKRNEPAYIRQVADKIANIHNLSPETVAAITTVNAARLFDIRVDL
jgi:TatD DNase family protein